jgi:hypothetical protein
MSLVAWTRLGPYEIQAAIGAGGMGEVYKARDTRLDRTVAIKILPAELSADPDRRVRFEREARAIASIAIHCDPCAAACSSTIRTARSFISGEHFGCRPMGSLLSPNGPSDNPGTIQRVRARRGPVMGRSTTTRAPWLTWCTLGRVNRRSAPMERPRGARLGVERASRSDPSSVRPESGDRVDA